MRVTVNTPTSVPASAAFASVAVMVTPLGALTSVRHALAPAAVGAVELADVGPTLMSAKSVLPASSVTVSRTTVVPVAGAVTFALGPFDMTVAPTVQAYVEIERLHAAPLP